MVEIHLNYFNRSTFCDMVWYEFCFIFVLFLETYFSKCPSNLQFGFFFCLLSIIIFSGGFIKTTQIYFNLCIFILFLSFLKAYLLGFLFDWRTTAWCCSVGSLVLSFAMWAMKETPYWLVENDR